MAIGISKGNSKKRSQRAQPFCEINITPMVDVMLVLLVIFMVAAPMMSTGVTVDLPKTSAAAIPGQDEPLTVAVKADGKIYIGDSLLTLEELQPKLKAIAGEKMGIRIFVRGDKNVDYGTIMGVVSEINAGGFKKVALLTDPNGALATNKGK